MASAGDIGANHQVASEAMLAVQQRVRAVASMLQRECSPQYEGVPVDVRLDDSLRSQGGQRRVQVFVNMLAGKMKCIEVASSCAVIDVKMIIHNFIPDGTMN